MLVKFALCLYYLCIQAMVRWVERWLKKVTPWWSGVSGQHTTGRTSPASLKMRHPSLHLGSCCTTPRKLPQETLLNNLDSLPLVWKWRVIDYARFIHGTVFKIWRQETDHRKPLEHFKLLVFLVSWQCLNPDFIIKFMWHCYVIHIHSVGASRPLCFCAGLVSLKPCQRSRWWIPKWMLAWCATRFSVKCTT